MLTERVSRPNLNRHSPLNDFAAIQRYRMILGLRPTNNDEKCSCKASLDYSHAVSCVASRKICAESRHDMVRDAVKRSLDQFNVNSTIEYRPLAFAPGGRLLQALWDVCVTTPTCKSYLDKHSDTAG